MTLNFVQVILNLSLGGRFSLDAFHYYFFKAIQQLKDMVVEMVLKLTERFINFIGNIGADSSGVRVN